MNVIGGAASPPRPCNICTETDLSEFGGRSLVKTSCSKTHQVHLDCIIKRLKAQESIPLNKRRCCESDQPALPLRRNSDFLVQNACKNNYLESLRLLGQILELNKDTPIESIYRDNRDIAIDILCTQAYLLLRNYQDNVLKEIEDKVMPKIKNYLPQPPNIDSGQASNPFLRFSNAIASTSIETELKKLARMDMVIAVGGMVNAGKSTTINAIVGFELLPERNTPMTLIPTLIRHKPNQKVPDLSIKDPQKINKMLSQLQSRKLDKEQQNKIPMDDFKKNYKGSEEISSTLTKLNDLFSLADELKVENPLKNYCQIDSMLAISVEYSILRNHDNVRARGQLVLMDTPGYNETRWGNLSGTVHKEVRNQLGKASGIIGLMEHSKFDQTQAGKFCEELGDIARQSRCNISAWVNKWDQANHNSTTEEQLKDELTKSGVLTRDNIYTISARNALLAKNAIRELEQNGELPNWEENPLPESVRF
ncbi:dynamin family protein [Endozoicomonas sp. ONNA2]|uniref:dynamin family protein n=1 Tax=Endozoicomonas sp. ONNA2 TaxID=2828741 RepID=UPI002148A320|nr:dynamin family protein [Endozoicomonas sp. ONNA2]